MTTVMESVESGARLRVGVVGSGLSGLHVAWALSCAEHFPAGHPLATRPPEVHLFERASAIGFDAASVDVLGGRARVDVPMRGFYVSYYPRLATLYRATGVQFRRRDHTIAFFRSHESKAFATASPVFLYNMHTLHGTPITLPQLSGNSQSIWRSLRISYHWVRFYYWCERYMSDGAYRAYRLNTFGRETFKEFLTNLNFDREFVDDTLYPVVAAICTCAYHELDAYPASVIIEFFGLGLFFEGGSVVTKGVREVCTTLSSRLEHVHLNAAVEEVYNTEAGVAIKCVGRDALMFDYVIFASQANQALRMLRDPSPEEREALSRYQYIKTKVVVHSDPRFLPERREDWRALNYLTYHDRASGRVEVMSSTYMNALLPAIENEPTPVLSTWNPLFAPDPALVVAETVFERPLVTLESATTHKLLWKVQGTNRRFFVGAYAGEGIPLLEGCVESGLRVAKMFGVDESLIYRLESTDGPKDSRFGAVPVSALVQHDNPWRSALWVQVAKFLQRSLHHLLNVIF